MSVLRFLLMAFLVLFPLRALAEEMHVFPSLDILEIESNFDGAELALFGAIRRDANTVARAGSGYDIVITVSGPPVDLVARRKEEVAVLWVNRSSETFRAVPSYFAALSNRPVEDITFESVRERFALGADRVVMERAAVGSAENSEAIEIFRRAMVRLRRNHGFYLDDGDAVTFPMEGLFQARLSLPADVPDGLYTVRAYLFAGGVLLATDVTGFEIVKTGVEALVFNLAHRQPLYYGLGSVLLAIAVGWIGGMIFRRD